MDSVRTVAFSLMDSRGFAAVTVEQIAAESGVSPSTIYRYFGTKEALVLSAARSGQLAERVRADESKRTALEAVQRAAVKVWGADTDVSIELGLVVANPDLTRAWERQLLDQRAAVADALAHRRGATSAGTRDVAVAAAALAMLMTLLPKWHIAGGDKKGLDKLLAKSVTALSA
jgi:AcrR family transcriptional regulator